MHNDSLKDLALIMKRRISPVVDATTFRYLISLAIHEKLGMCLMDVVTAYLYGPLDYDIYMKIPEGLNCLQHIIQVLENFTR